MKQEKSAALGPQRRGFELVTTGAPCETSSAKPAPIGWISKSLNAFTGWLLKHDK